MLQSLFLEKEIMEQLQMNESTIDEADLERGNTDQQTVEQAGCSTCSGGDSEPPSFVYAIGKIEPRFPRLSVEKEFAQVTGRSETAGLTDSEALHKVLSQRQNRYLLKQLCWVFTIEGLETYLLHPRDSSDLDLLLDSLRTSPNKADVDVIVGLRGPIAPVGFCNGLMLPIVMFTQIYSFDVTSLVKAIPRPKEIPEKEFTKTAEEVFARIMQMADNAGATDEHRALNYLVLRYHAIYAKAVECHKMSCSLTGVEVRPSRLSGTRNILDVIFSYTNRQTDVLEKFFVRVDITEEFPFLVTKLSPYFDR
jgi:PatG Domain